MFMRSSIAVATAFYVISHVALLFHIRQDGGFEVWSAWNLVRPVAIVICFWFYLKERGKWALWLSVWAFSGFLRFVLGPPAPAIAYGEAAAELILGLVALIAWRCDPHRSHYQFSLLNRIRSLFVRKVPVKTIQLGRSIDDVVREFGELILVPDESFLKGCNHYELFVERQEITLAVDQGEVQGVVYAPSATDEPLSIRIWRLRHFLNEHSFESKLRFLVNNGFGLIYRSKDLRTRAAYSFGADIFSISRSSYELT